MASKRKRASIDLSTETIQKEINDANEVLRRINNFKTGLEIRKISEALTMFKGKAHFDVASVLALMFGFSTIMWILFCIRHVPKVFCRYKNTCLRAIFTIVNYLCPESSLSEIVLQEIMSILEEFAPNIPLTGTYTEDFENALNAITKRGELNVAGFLAPPVDNCLQCGGHLSAPNPPSKCILYSTSCPKALTKLLLRCSSCKISYGYSMKTGDDKVLWYYSPKIMAKNSVLEITKVSYVEKSLYLWQTSLM